MHSHYPSIDPIPPFAAAPQTAPSRISPLPQQEDAFEAATGIRSASKQRPARVAAPVITPAGPLRRSSLAPTARARTNLARSGRAAVAPKTFIVLDGAQNVPQHFQSQVATPDTPSGHLPSAALEFQPRPHPHVTTYTLYISGVPADFVPDNIAGVIRECEPFTVTLYSATPPNERLNPDVYYDWMSKTGAIEFTSLYKTEKALAILQDNPHLRFLIVSPFTPEGPHHAAVYHVPDPAVALRYIVPTRQISAAPPTDLSPEGLLRSQLPSLGEVFELCRMWGPLRSVKVWLLDGIPSDGYPVKWRAAVQFWNEDEAMRFQFGVGEGGFLLKGWQVLIPAVPAHLASLSMGHTLSPSSFPALTAPPPVGFHAPEAFSGLATPPHAGDWPLYPLVPTNSIPHLYGGALPDPKTPPTSHIAPWAAHNVLSGQLTPITPTNIRRATDAHIRRHSDKSSALSASIGSGRSGRAALARSSMGSMASHRQMWCETLSKDARGATVTTGLVSSDGISIQHVGPGSTSSSGLVDYSNLYVKNLDSDINSHFLSSTFGKIGVVISAKVMRDDQQRSKGFGFVSFELPQCAAQAIEIFNNTKMGSQIISVAFHEPRMNRSAQHAHVRAPITPQTPGRAGQQNVPSFSSPVSAEGEAARDEIRSLSPADCRVTLNNRVSTIVRSYAVQHPSMSRELIPPVVELLVAMDLEAIPLLYDHEKLKARIGEIVSSLQDQDLEDTAATRTPADPTMSDAELLVRLRQQIDLIDPANVAEIMALLTSMLSPAEIRRAVESGKYRAIKYGLAKATLNSRSALSPPAQQALEAASRPLSMLHSPPASPVATPDIEYEPLDTVQLETLAKRHAFDPLMRWISILHDARGEGYGHCWSFVI